MSVFTSTDFASVIVDGTDWRDTAKSSLEELSKIRTDNDGFNFGFLYVSDALAEDLSSILTLFKSVTQIDEWVGSVGIGICGSDRVSVGQPAISAMITRFDEQAFELFHFSESDPDRAGQISHIKKWLQHNHPMLVLSHLDPSAKGEAFDDLDALNKLTNGFIVGGLSSSRKTHAQIAGDITNKGPSGVIFSQSVPVATMVSQGCTPLGKTHTITRGHDHLIYELDGEKALDVLNEELRTMVIKAIDQDPNDVLLDDDILHTPDSIPEEYRGLFDGQIHVAFPNAQSDQKDLLVRNIVGADQDEGSLAVSQAVCSGENLVFVRRNDEIIKSDLIENLSALKERVKAQEGSFKPKGAVYISCLARAGSNFSDHDEKDIDDHNADEPPEGPHSEIDIIRDIIGPIPLTGFYAAGEISNAKMYGYTGILILFL